MTVNGKDALAGAIFILIAAAFAYMALGLEIGSALRMGPGYFPLVLAGLLAIFGLVVIFQGINREPTPTAIVPVRGLVLILAAPVLFGFAVRPLGLVPAVVIVTLCAAFASRRMTVPLGLALSVGLTVFCVLVFSVGLGLPLRLFGPRLGF